MAFLRHVIELFVNPFFICVLVLGLSVFFLWRNRAMHFVRVALLFVFLVLLLISTGWLPRYLTYHLESQYPVINKVNQDIRWIVVLSGGQSNVPGLPANDLLSSASIKRLIEGIRIHQMLPAATLVLSGGGSTGEQPEALLLKQLAELLSIPAKDLVLETRSINTADQARELKAIVHDEPFYLVTSAIHMPRSIALCEQQGLHPVAAPTDFTFFWTTESLVKMTIPNVYNLSYFSIALHELLGRAWASVSKMQHD